MICYSELMHDPVVILQRYQTAFMTGRPLDQSSLTEPLDGDTCSVFVSRSNILETAFQEMKELLISDTTAGCFRNPLSVTFYGEAAIDLGLYFENYIS